jgi:hypothetical protein
MFPRTEKARNRSLFVLGAKRTRCLRFFSELIDAILKSKLRKLEGIKYGELKENIKNVLKIIPKETYMNIFKGSYEREIEYKKKSKSKKTSKNYKN